MKLFIGKKVGVSKEEKALPYQKFDAKAPSFSYGDEAAPKISLY